HTPAASTGRKDLRDMFSPYKKIGPRRLTCGHRFHSNDCGSRFEFTTNFAEKPCLPLRFA
ncbi:MAG: hypothetical protein ACI4SV_06140, partial [Duodenibacillus sp.]